LRTPAFQRRPRETGPRPGHQDQAHVPVHEHAVPVPGRAAVGQGGAGGRGLRAAPSRRQLQPRGLSRADRSTKQGAKHMAWGESKAWLAGELNQGLYQDLLEDAAQLPGLQSKRKKVVHPEAMPCEMSRQGLLKHLQNEKMNTRMESVDAYMQLIPPGSRSGKHRHLAEECVYVLEGRGYDLHQDCDVEITDTYHWKAQDEVKRYEWEAGDVIYIPPNTIHQHFNADPDRPVR